MVINMLGTWQATCKHGLVNTDLQEEGRENKERVKQGNKGEEPCVGGRGGKAKWWWQETLILVQV